MGNPAMIPKDFEAQYGAARTAGQKAAASEPRASAVRYVRSSARLAIDLTNGTTVLIPVRLLQGLEEASAKQLARVEITGNGYGLHWEELDCDFTVPGLVSGIFGTKTWMSALARAAGRGTSPAKARAARENGKKGGRSASKDKKRNAQAA